MGHVVNPLNFRLGHSRYWNSVWGLSNLNNYAQLSNLDFLILKKILSWFRVVLSPDVFRFVFMLNNVRILRSSSKTLLILQFYDLFTNNIHKSILNKVREQLLKYNLFSVRKWKKFKWLNLDSEAFLKTKRKFIFFINNFSPVGIFYKKNILKVQSLSDKFTFYPSFIKSKKQFFNKRFGAFSISSSKYQKTDLIVDDSLKLNKVLFFRFFLMRLRTYLFSNLDLIKNALCYYLKPLVSLLPSNIILIGLNDMTVDAKFISNFIAYHLENRYYLVQIFKVLWVYLNKSIKNRMLYGYQVKLSGRFKKNEKAVYLIRKVGNLGRYDIKRFVDYSFSVARMRLGVTVIKVWLSLPSARDMLIKSKSTNHFTKFYLPWVSVNNQNEARYSIPVNALKSYVSGSSLSWPEIIHSYSLSTSVLPTRILGRFNRSHLSHYSYIY